VREDQVITKFIEDIRDLKERIEEIYLFGSRAREEERPVMTY